MRLPCPAKKMLKTLSPGTESIQESQRHGRAFISETLEFRFNSRELAGQVLLIVFLQRCVISVKKSLSHVLQAFTNIGAWTIKSPPRELCFAQINFQEMLN